jgi:hypothetical protein
MTPHELTMRLPVGDTWPLSQEERTRLALDLLTVSRELLGQPAGYADSVMVEYLGNCVALLRTSALMEAD